MLESPSMNKLKGSIKRIELILEKGKEYQQKKESLFQTKQKQPDPELTLRPKISYTEKTKDVRREDIWKDLHSDAEKYHSKKTDKAKDTIEYIKAPHEYTFTPGIQRLRLKQSPAPISRAKSPAPEPIVIDIVTAESKRQRITIKANQSPEELAT